MPAVEAGRRSQPTLSFDLVESKLRSPPIRQGIVPRPALVDLLDAQSVPLILE